MKCLFAIVLVLFSSLASAEVVVPIDSVSSHVNIRMAQDAAAEIVGRLNRGDYLQLVDSTDGWHEVEIAGGATGFISAAWVRVLENPPSAVSGDAAQSTVVPVTPANAKQETHESGIEEGFSAAEDVLPTEEELHGRTENVDEFAPTREAAAAGVDSTQDALAAGQDDAVMSQAADTGSTIAAEVGIAEDASPAADVSNELPPAEPPAAEIAAMPAAAGETIESQAQAGPSGASGTAIIEGTVGYLARFETPTSGGSSLIFDDGNNIGIGTTEPVQRLEVNGNIQIHEQNSSVAGLMITQSDGETGYIMHNRASTLTIGAGSIDRITIDRDGNIGFGVAQPSQPLEMASGAHVTSGGVWTNSSSRARKENIADLSLTDALTTLADLQPVHFNYKNDQLERYIGFIAEDVPDLVATESRDGLSPMDITAILTKVVQAQQEKITELEARLDQL